MTTRVGTALNTSGLRAIDLPEHERTAHMERAWQGGYGFAFNNYFTDTGRELPSNELLAEFVRSKIRAAVNDPDTAERLAPYDYPMGAKRVCLDDGYFETFNRDNVALVDLRTEPVETVTANSIRTSANDFSIDTIIFATGFDAVTGALSRIDIRGTDGRSIGEIWADGATTYLGLAVAGFPNLFTITGPGSPSVTVNVLPAIEQHVDWIADYLVRLRSQGTQRVEASPQAQAWWDEQVAEAATLTMHQYAPSSWYLGTNVPGKPRRMLTYFGGLDKYRHICDEVAADGYRGFVAG